MSTNSLSSRLEELRSGLPQSPPNERAYSGYNTPSRYSGSFMPSQTANVTSNDMRVSLQRRFTTSSDVAPNLFPQQSAAFEQVDSTSALRQQQLDRKRQDIEALKQKKREFEQELEKFQAKQMREYQELEKRLTRDIDAMDLNRYNMNAGHMSEPSTPPSERVADYGFPSIYNRHNRYSSSSIMSPPSANRMSRSGSMLTSPPYDRMDMSQQASGSDKLPSKSVPGSRRGSNDRMSAYFAAGAEAAGPKLFSGSNRYSMPVTATMATKRMSAMDETGILDRHNTTKFLFGDDDDHTIGAAETITSPGGTSKTVLKMQTTEDNFPILRRQTESSGSGKPQSSHSEFDLAGPQSPSTASSNGWPAFPRHRQGQQSLPQNLFDPELSGVTSAPTSNRQSMELGSPPTYTARPTRHSMEAALASTAKNLFSPGSTTPTNRPGLVSMQPSYSTNDIPTMKNPLSLAKSPPRQAAEDAFHKHNQSMGRIPPGAVNRTSRDLSTIASKLQEIPKEEKTKPSPPQASALQATSATFGPSITASLGGDPTFDATGPVGIPQYGNASFYNGYNMQQLMNMGMQPMQLNGQNNFATASMFPYQAAGQYGFFPPGMNQSSVPQNSQTRNAGQRRGQTGDDGSRFSNVQIESYIGKIYELCKDQHGCRYLQRQLETRNPDAVRMIFDETYEHVVELMTDPFGNYLCQKLLEHADDHQRTTLVNNAAPQMVKIALNQHGTRALQKMIEYISTPEQTQTIVNALRDKVVVLIQDLNGNHVIQKCLNRLSSEDAQFIFDAVGFNCVVVGTHRHGCCVLQRCIDHASEPQRAALIQHITASAYQLVQDPFGNYVLQYIVDLKQTKFINPLCYGFQGRIVPLSRHKFSSNVIEKMIRGAEPHVTTIMIDEMLAGNDLEGMLKDQFANYVVQTALDYAEVDARQRLVDAIKPMLPAIRQTPYGRRIQSKITANDTAGNRPAPSNDGGATARIPPSAQQPDLVSNPQRPSTGTFAGLAPAPAFAVNGFNSGNALAHGVMTQNGMNGKGNGPLYNSYSNAPQSNGQNFVPYDQSSQQNGGFSYF